jgi:hypothetical protein
LPSGLKAIEVSSAGLSTWKILSPLVASVMLSRRAGASLSVTVQEAASRRLSDDQPSAWT